MSTAAVWTSSDSKPFFGFDNVVTLPGGMFVDLGVQRGTATVDTEVDDFIALREREPEDDCVRDGCCRLSDCVEEELVCGYVGDRQVREAIGFPFGGFRFESTARR